MLLGLVTLWIFFLRFNLLECGNSFVKSNGIKFERDTAFDGYVCMSVSAIHLGHSRSRIECSKACAEVTQCKSFFYNTGDHTCSGSTVIHQNTYGCGFKIKTVYYINFAAEEYATTTPLPSPTAPVLSNSECDTNWIAFDSHCYIEITTGLLWPDAQQNCFDLAGYLLSIETAEESYFIESTFGFTGYWIGGSKSVQNSNWVWESGYPVAFTNWALDEENDADEYYMFLTDYGQWTSRKANIKENSVCEKTT